MTSWALYPKKIRLARGDAKLKKQKHIGNERSAMFALARTGSGFKYKSKGSNACRRYKSLIKTHKQTKHEKNAAAHEGSSSKVSSKFVQPRELRVQHSHRVENITNAKNKICGFMADVRNINFLCRVVNDLICMHEIGGGIPRLENLGRIVCMKRQRGGQQESSPRQRVIAVLLIKRKTPIAFEETKVLYFNRHDFTDYVPCSVDKTACIVVRGFTTKQILDESRKHVLEIVECFPGRRC